MGGVLFFKVSFRVAGVLDSDGTQGRKPRTERLG